MPQVIYSNLWGVLLFSEAVTVMGCVGAALVAAGVLTAVVATKKKPAAAAGSSGESNAQAGPALEGAERRTTSQGEADLAGASAHVRLSMGGSEAGDGAACKAGFVEMQGVQDGEGRT